MTVVPIPNPAAVHHPTETHWGLLVNLDTAGSLALNHSACRIWSLVDGRRSVAQIIGGVAHAYAVPAEQIRAEVLAFLALLASAGFIGFEIPFDRRQFDAH